MTRYFVSALLQFSGPRIQRTGYISEVLVLDQVISTQADFGNIAEQFRQDNIADLQPGEEMTVELLSVDWLPNQKNIRKPPRYFVSAILQVYGTPNRHIGHVSEVIVLDRPFSTLTELRNLEDQLSQDNLKQVTLAPGERLVANVLSIDWLPAEQDLRGGAKESYDAVWPDEGNQPSNGSH